MMGFLRQLKQAIYPRLITGGVRCMVALLFVAASGCDSARTESTPDGAVPVAGEKWGRPQIGTKATSFSLPDLSGRLTSLSDFQGKVVVLNFWATWCGPCRVEMPSMEQTYRKLKAEGLEILAISSDVEGVRVTRPFVEANGFTFQVLHDTEYQTSASYGVRTLPMSYVVDREGVIQHRIFGARDWNSPEAHKMLRTLLQQSLSKGFPQL